ncbi:MAG: class I SAM-dependent methyltransferase [Vicinamibacterales bacterium]
MIQSTSGAAFGACEICGDARWETVYEGLVRDGSVGVFSGDAARVGKCTSCGVLRLEERWCRDESIYADAAYRSLIGEGASAKDFHAKHDAAQLKHLVLLGSQLSFRGKVVADVGCGGGSMLDLASGMASACIGVEPNREYHGDLRQKGYGAFSSCEEAAQEWAGKVDVAVTLNVIEHVSNPVGFLRAIGDLLADDGTIVVGTPNAGDWLLSQLPEYRAFFYRTVHRFYFDASSLQQCARQAGLAVSGVRYFQRYGLSNAMQWLRDRRPTGGQSLAGLADSDVDVLWSRHLERTGQADQLFVFLRRQPSPSEAE